MILKAKFLVEEDSQLTQVRAFCILGDRDRACRDAWCAARILVILAAREMDQFVFIRREGDSFRSTPVEGFLQGG